MPVTYIEVVGLRQPLVAEVCNEIWKIKPTVDELEAAFNENGEFVDLNNLQDIYFDNNGTFMVIADDEKIVGTGGIKRLEEEICELKKMWIMREYRAQGWGVKIARELIKSASERGYKKVRLELYDPPKQQRAIAFYRELDSMKSPLTETVLQNSAWKSNCKNQASACSRNGFL